MIYGLYAVYFLTLFFNIFKNKKPLITIVGSLLIIGLMYLLNINRLNYSGGFAGANGKSFLLISIVLTIILIIIKIKYQMKERTVSFVLVILLTLWMFYATATYYGGLMLQGEEYFKYNLRDWISYLVYVLIQCNLCIDFISQKKLI